MKGRIERIDEDKALLQYSLSDRQNNFCQLSQRTLKLCIVLRRNGR